MPATELVGVASIGDKPVFSAMSRRGRNENPITIVPCCALGGPEKFYGGNFVLTDLQTCLQPRFWDEHPNIMATVNCIGPRSGWKQVKYPDNAARSELFFIDARDSKTLPERFRITAGHIEDMLEQGFDVLVHCRYTFHRGPGIWAGLMTRICGIPYQVAVQSISPLVAVF